VIDHDARSREHWKAVVADVATDILAGRTTADGANRSHECQNVGRDEALILPGKRPLASRDLSDFRLFRHLERIVYLKRMSLRTTYCAKTSF
jgi:hypothetical protein